MEIKQVKRMDLSNEEETFVRAMLDELWVVEGPWLPTVPELYGGIDYMLISAFNKLEDIFLGYVGGELVGFLANQVDCYYEVDKLVIHPDHRGKGYGRIFIHGFALFVESPLKVIITPENKRAVKFYEDAGFELVTHNYTVDNIPFTCVIGSLAEVIENA